MRDDQFEIELNNYFFGGSQKRLVVFILFLTNLIENDGIESSDITASKKMTILNHFIGDSDSEELKSKKIFYILTDLNKAIEIAFDERIVRKPRVEVFEMFDEGREDYSDKFEKDPHNLGPVKDALKIDKDSLRPFTYDEEFCKLLGLEEKDE